MLQPLVDTTTSETPPRELVNPLEVQPPARVRHHHRPPTSQAALGLKERRLQEGYEASGAAVARPGAGRGFRPETQTEVGGARRCHPQRGERRPKAPPPSPSGTWRQGLSPKANEPRPLHTLSPEPTGKSSYGGPPRAAPPLCYPRRRVGNKPSSRCPRQRAAPTPGRHRRKTLSPPRRPLPRVASTRPLPAPHGCSAAQGEDPALEPPPPQIRHQGRRIRTRPPAPRIPSRSHIPTPHRREGRRRQCASLAARGVAASSPWPCRSALGGTGSDLRDSGSGSLGHRRHHGRQRRGE